MAMFLLWAGPMLYIYVVHMFVWGFGGIAKHSSSRRVCMYVKDTCVGVKGVLALLAGGTWRVQA